jgi:predicted small metal-binding protein
LLDDHLDARPSTLPPRVVVVPGYITPVIFIPSDRTVPESEQQQIADALVEIERWYDEQLGDMHLRFGPTRIVHGEQTADWYLKDDKIWAHGPDELRRSLGYSPWDDGHIVLLMGRGLVGWAGGAGNSNAGFAVVGLEPLVDPANCDPPFSCADDIFHGTAIHELGHALTLPHSAPPSVMDWHHDYRTKVLLDDDEWPEYETVRSLRFTDKDVDEVPDPGAGGCGDVDYAGRCDGTELVWCENESVRSYDCGASGMSCGWQDDVVGNNCIAAKSACGDVDYYGYCDGETLTWCEGGGLQSYDCGGVGMRCGWQDDTVGNNCL